VTDEEPARGDSVLSLGGIRTGDQVRCLRGGRDEWVTVLRVLPDGRLKIRPGPLCQAVVRHPPLQ
jgi:hypothetical protein